MFIFCCRNISEFDYGALPQTDLGVRGNNWYVHCIIGVDHDGSNRRQGSNGVVPGSYTCKVKSLAGHLAGSEKQCLPRKPLREGSKKVRSVVKF